MKHFILAFLITTALFSCSKQSDDIARPSSRKIEFTVYNSTKTYTEVNAAAQTVTGVKFYTFVGTKNPTTENIFTLTLMTDSLRPGMYSTKTGVVSFREGNTVLSNVSSDVVVNITSNVDGVVNGTFSGSLYDHNTGKNCTISNGSIQNIKVFYK